MSEEHSSQLRENSKLSLDETETSNHHRSKKHKNDASDSFDDAEFETNKKNKFEELHRKIDEMHSLMRDNDNADIEKIKTVFGNLRKIIDGYEETLKTKVRAIEQQKKPSTVEYITLTEKITQFFRSKNEGSETNVDQSIENINKLLADIEQFKTQIIKLKNEKKKSDYCIDEINNLETNIETVLGHTCITEFAIPGTYPELKCKGRACKTCGKCRDWYYSGDRTTWEWIVKENEWDEEDRKRWDDGEYKNRFQSRNGYTCVGRFGYYYDRNDDYHGGHITFDCNYYCRACGSFLYDRDYGPCGCCQGSRSSYTYDVFPYCQCINNIKQK